MKRGSCWKVFYLVILLLVILNITVFSTLADDITTRSKLIYYEDPIGFSLQYPRDWKLKTNKDTGRVIISGPDDKELSIWPVFTKNC